MIFSPPSSILLQVPHIEQEKNGECLAACVAMVCAYKEITVRYSRLVKVLDTRNEAGAAFYNVNNLEKLGIQVLHKKFANLNDLYNLLLDGWPPIVGVQTLNLPHWNKIDVAHAVVVIGMDAKNIYLNDPAFSDEVFSASLGEFDLSWLERDEQFAVLSK